ncbi:MAG: helical backbone metal receptor [Planctomycetota bacterium]|nr:helical backbone metal receptor [Planctomycetota bacterium]
MRPILLAILLLVGCRDEAERGGIVSLLPSFTEIVVELGAADQLVGCTQHCKPGREVARVPWQGPDALEPIVRLAPAVVLRQVPRDGPDALGEALRRAEIDVVAVQSETIADIKTAIRLIGKVVRRTDRAAALATRLDRALAATRAAVAGKTPPGVLFVIGRDAGQASNIQAAGVGTFLNELIECAGGRNVVATLPGAYPRVELEQLVRLAPDVIIDNLPGEENVMDAWRAILHVPAIENGKVFPVRDPSLLIPGPRLADVVARLAEMFHGTP